jgi:hypothetical protein
VYEDDLATGARRVLLNATANVLYENPALEDGRLLYEHISSCAQELVLASPPPSHVDRVLLTLASTVTRDPGWEPGYVENYNSASICSNRPAGPGGTTTLGSTALGTTSAYVSEAPTDVDHTRIVAVGLP